MMINSKILVFLTLSSLLSFSALSHAGQALDKETGLVIDAGFDIVKANCTACHSAALVTQNRMSRETWLDTIRWMQEKQGLWPLMQNEAIILDYLEKHYSPTESGRRKNLPEHLLPPKQ
ncbi:hypothetical protein RGQ13_08860 [Thalassotalea psychrophila]|uniref:Uncharacterized protein n=1 Tax=Thalassotalea psychrophila TaxID=3065647 RepID=A0ABY9TZR5_9GAMM|nr:hypothetical protein RGQ13_08860 [Colwelliaceae bacterium SQ149]